MKTISFASSLALVTYLASNSQFVAAAPTPSLLGGSFWLPTFPSSSSSTTSATADTTATIDTTTTTATTDALDKRVPGAGADDDDYDTEAAMSSRVDSSIDAAAIFKAACEGYRVCLAEAQDPQSCAVPDEEVSCDTVLENDTSSEKEDQSEVAEDS